MAFNVGQAPAAILVKSLSSNVYVDKNLAYMNQGDKDGYNVYKYDIKNILRARTDNPSASMTATSKKQAFKRSLFVYETIEPFNPADYESHWKKYQPTGEFQWQTLPTEVQDTWVDLLLSSTAEAVEDELTNGTSGNITGLIPQLLNSALVNLNGGEATPLQVVDNLAIGFRAHAGGSGETLGVALTTSNIFDKLELLKQKQTKAQRKRLNKKYMVSHKTADIMSAAQRLTQVYKGVEVTQEGILKYSGIEIIVNPSFPDDTILLCSMSGDIKSDAIQLGTSMSSDFNNLTVDRLNPLNRVWAMLLTFALDIFVVRPEEVGFYTTEALV